MYVAGNPRQSEAFEATLTVNSPRCKRLLDTEATRTLITEDVTRGVAEITVQAGDKSCFCICFVVPKGRTVLFGQEVTYQTAAIGTNRGKYGHNSTNRHRARQQGHTSTSGTAPRRHAFSLRASIDAELNRAVGK